MPDLDLEARRHPIGTLAIVGVYGVLFVVGWRWLSRTPRAGDA